MSRSLLTLPTRLTLSCALILAALLAGPGTALSQETVRCGDPLDSRYASLSLTPGQWRTLADMPRPRSEFAAAAIDDWIYVVGGFGGLAQVDCFHPATGTWATAPDVPIGAHHLGVAELNGLLYVAGGYTEEGPATDALRVYDPSTSEWEMLSPMPTARGALGLAAHDGKLYAVGGATEGLGGPVTGALEIYDPETDTWSEGAAMPTPREHLAVAAGAGRIFTAGGRAHGDESASLASAFGAYDPASDSWEALPPLPTPRGGVSGVFVSGKMVVLGGERGTTTFDTAEAYDMTSGTWQTLPPMPTPRHGVASAAIGDTIFAIAGSTQAGVVENTGATEALTLPSDDGDSSPERPASTPVYQG